MSIEVVETNGQSVTENEIKLSPNQLPPLITSKGIMEETPVLRPSSTESNEIDENSNSITVKPDFSIIWSDLSYVTQSVNRSKNKQITPSDSSTVNENTSTSIFNKLNGQINSGELTALMGPSGCGKTTLIECIAGIRTNGRKGNVLLKGKEKVKLAFIPQTDSFFILLTVKESLTYASKFRKSTVKSKSLKIKKDEKVIIDQEKGYKNNNNNSDEKKKDIKFDIETDVSSVIKILSLEKCTNTLISNCSGGQLKRLSIAQELLAKPNILILGKLIHFIQLFYLIIFFILSLDEPTSGLDSQTAVQTLQVLHKLAIGSSSDGSTVKPMAILITIHQPSAKIFSMFHKVYFLSCIGKCIYQSKPGDQLIKFLRSFNLEVPQFTNISDYLMDVASGEFGKEILVSMSIQANKVNERGINSNEQGQGKNLSQMIHHEKYSLSSHVGLHFTRSTKVMLRDPHVSIIRIASHILVGLFMGYLYSEPSIGSSGGCPPKPEDLIDPRKIDQVLNIIDIERGAVANNIGLMFFSTIFLLFGGMLPTVLTYPLEMSTLAKERTNGWYSIFSYYIGRTVADIPLQVLCPVLYMVIVFILSNQPLELPRIIDVCIPSILLSMIAQTHGVLVSAIFSSSIQLALFIAPISTIPLIVFSGFFIKRNSIPYYLTPGIYISYLRYASDMILIALYGMNRCGIYAASNVVTIEKRMKSYLTHVISQGLAVDEITNDTFDTNYLLDNVADSMAISNVTQPLVRGITRPFSSKVLLKNGHSVTGVLAEFDLTDDDWAFDAFILIAILLFIRLLILIVIHRNGRLVK